MAAYLVPELSLRRRTPPDQLEESGKLPLAVRKVFGLPSPIVAFRVSGEVAGVIALVVDLLGAGREKR
jgi:hypothetical protein